MASDWEFAATVNQSYSDLTPGEYTSERRGLSTNKHTDYTPDYCIAWFIDLCLLRTLSTIILCSLYLVFIYSWEKRIRATRRTPPFPGSGRGPVPDHYNSPLRYFFFLPPSPLFPFLPEMRPTAAARRGDPGPILQTIALPCYTQRYFFFRKLHSVRTLYVVCEVAFVLVCDEVLWSVIAAAAGRYSNAIGDKAGAEVPARPLWQCSRVRRHDERSVFVLIR